ncbi:MAG: leucine-rich repeat domain-containing protein [Bacteroidales bacterium]|nr:leucine-rich repeat domain-containing protein [Bacteroidales bacterium]
MKKLSIILLNLIIGINIVFADDYTGLCGENLYWQYNPNDSVLEIRGYGNMEEYEDYTDVPWHMYMFNTKVIRLPQGLTSISAYAFQDGFDLEEVLIPDKVVKIGYRAFASCSKLVSLNIPDGVRYIDEGAFMHIPNIVYHGYASGSPWDATCVNGYVFEDLIFRDASKSCLVKCNTGHEGKILIPEQTLKIEHAAFSGCKLVTEIFVPQSVKDIHERVFFDCDSLSRINVDERNPYFCSVDGVLFSKDMTLLKAYPENRPGNTYAIPTSVETIGEMAFYGSNHLQSMVIPENVRFIHKGGFTGCHSLKRMTIKPGLLAIRDEAFFYCTGLETIELPETLCEIGGYAFLNCKSLVNVNIPSKIKIIRPSTFERCESLKSIYTGDHVEKIEKSAFKECSSLEEIKTSDYLSEIGDWAFEWCENLKSISFGSGLRRIGKYAFDAPLSSCSITCKAYEPPYLDETSIYRWKGYWVKIYVPQSSVSAYQRTYPWNKFDIKAAY